MTADADRDVVSSRRTQVVIFIGIMWAVFLLDADGDLRRYGLVPRSQEHLIGILAIPFLHASLGHIIANTITVGSFLFAMSFAPWINMWRTVGFMVIASGALIWLIHPPLDSSEPLVGASGLGCALVGHVLALAIMDLSITTLAFFGAQIWLFWDLYLIAFLPNDYGVSWVGHWCGIAVGVWIAHAHGSTV